jgi:hypothetical protein
VELGGICLINCVLCINEKQYEETLFEISRQVKMIPQRSRLRSRKGHEKPQLPNSAVKVEPDQFMVAPTRPKLNSFAFFQLLFQSRPFETAFFCPSFRSTLIFSSSKVKNKMESFLVPVRRSPGFDRPDLISEVERKLTTEGHAVICGEGGTG